MKKIAILTSGDGARGLELARIFNSGARFNVVLLLSDRPDAEALPVYASLGIQAASALPEEWRDNPAELIAALNDAGVDIIALDDFYTPLPGEIAERFPDRVVTLSETFGPRELVDAFPEDFSTEAAWAKTLGLNFDPSRAQTPPPLPTPPPAPEHIGDSSSATEPTPRQGGIPPTSLKSTYNTRRDDRPMPPTYLVWSILATVCCCMVAGVIAIICSARVSARFYAGDYDGAVKASELAQKWIIASIVVGVVTNAIYFPLAMFS